MTTLADLWVFFSSLRSMGVLSDQYMNFEAFTSFFFSWSIRFTMIFCSSYFLFVQKLSLIRNPWVSSLTCVFLVWYRGSWQKFILVLLEKFVVLRFKPVSYASSVLVSSRCCYISIVSPVIIYEIATDSLPFHSVLDQLFKLMTFWQFCLRR